MYKKLCPKCHQPSFSSCEFGTWLCPSCKYDLTTISHQNAESTPNKPQLKVIINSFAVKMINTTLNKYN